MGQVQSVEFNGADLTQEDVGDLEINSKNCSSHKQQHGESISRGKQQTKKDQFAKSKQNARKLSNVSHRNIQLLSMKPRSETDNFVDGLRSRRRSSLINLILGAPASGPRFSDDLCSLSSQHISECNFGIEFFPDVYRANTSVSSLRLESIEDVEKGEKVGSGDDVTKGSQQLFANQNRRRSSLGNLVPSSTGQPCDNPSGLRTKSTGGRQLRQESKVQQDKKPGSPKTNRPAAGNRQFFSNKQNLTSTLASIDLTSSFERHDKSVKKSASGFRPPLCKTKQNICDEFEGKDLKTRASKGRINQSGRVLFRSGSELSLYSNISASSSGTQALRGSISSNTSTSKKQCLNPLHETKLIIILQVCLPFILAGFGNMAAGLMLNKVAQWRVFQKVPTFFILLPPFVGLKGNIEMTLASRLSTLSNLNLLQTGCQRRRAFESNLVLILSQAIGLSVFAAFISLLCELLMGSNSSAGWLEELEIASVVVLASALATSMLLVLISSIVIPSAIGLANLIQVNPDNLSTLIAALYGDVTCVLLYGLIANWMFGLREQNILIWPVSIIAIALASWPVLTFMAHKFKETNRIALSSIPPMMASIVVSIGSGFVLALVVGRFHLIALYQPVVNGFGANLIAVQASRVSTWLWCTALNGSTSDSLESTKEKEHHQQPQPQEQVQKTSGLIATFTPSKLEEVENTPTDEPSLSERVKKLVKTILWSFCNKSPNSVAARLLLIMLVPAQTLYFFVIWLLSPTNYVVLTWQLYSIYITLCVIQVFILLLICEPLMTLLMRRNLDPDIFGISLLMALADLTGTICLTGAFFFLATIGDPNVVQ